MFPSHLPIDIMRIVSLNRLRKSRRLFDHPVRSKETLRCQETLSLDGVGTMSSSEHLRAIRRRAAGVEAPPSSDSHLRMERISRIRTAIAEGRYHVSAADLAQKLIQHIRTNRPPKL